MTDPLTLAKALIDAPSVTPARGQVFDVLEAALIAQGFAVERFIAGEAPDGPVENLLATRGDDSGAHIGFAGHLDVVPPGPDWRSDPFVAVERGGRLYGRGAVDMKGAIAAFVAAAASAPRRGRITLIITGDEEGPAVHGTRALIERMRARGLVPDFCLVGEPTSATMLGDTIKIGRRGSVTLQLAVGGVQGHVAYPQLADNPIPALLRILTAIEAIELDTGRHWFQPSNIEITSIDVGNAATNVIPAAASARISVRFNDLHRGQAIIDRIAAVVATEPNARLEGRISGEAFLTAPGPLSALVADAVSEVTGLTAELSTSGGTSDARFLVALCPVIEFGLPNATMHKRDESVAVADLRQLTAIYAAVLRRALD